MNAEDCYKGEYFTPLPELRTKMQGIIRCLLFDWDGVFNEGTKGINTHSTFAEADTMGINLLRYGLFLQNGAMPLQIILTGQHNESAELLARRDRFNGVYFNALDKAVALEHLLATFDLKPSEIAFFFDDVLDLPVASRCGVRVLIRRRSSPAFEQFVREKGYADYRTEHTPDSHALREATELLLTLIHDPARIFTDRLTFNESYRSYFEMRNQTVTPRFWQVKDRAVSEI